MAGVYFADMSSKSANYCFANKASPHGVLLLSEVALGTPLLKQHADYDADKKCKRAGCNSTWGQVRLAQPREHD